LGWCGTNGLERLGHDLRAVVDREDNICDAGGRKSLDLMLDHGLVGKLDERLGVRERLRMALVERSAGSIAGQASQRCRGQAYERAQTGSKPSDENDGCTVVSMVGVVEQLAALTFHVGGVGVVVVLLGGLWSSVAVFSTGRQAVNGQRGRRCTADTAKLYTVEDGQVKSSQGDAVAKDSWLCAPLPR
jgi:hypothetical protein